MDSGHWELLRMYFPLAEARRAVENVWCPVTKWYYQLGVEGVELGVEGVELGVELGVGPWKVHSTYL